jgi:trigger factor
LLKAIEDINSTKKRIKIEIPTEDIERKIKDSLEKARQKAKIPGFRQGKAPLNIVEKHFGKDAEADALEEIVPEFYRMALKEADIVPVAQPVLEGQINFQKNSPLTFALTVEIRPKIENLTYKNIKIKDIAISVPDSDIEGALKRLQESRAVYEAEDKPAEKDDLVTVDLEIKYEDKTISEKDQALKIGAAGLLKEISDAIVGKKSGETAEAETTFPDNFHMKELAGKKALVTCVIKNVKKKNLPAIDDELVKDLGYETTEALKTGLKSDIEKAKKDNAVRIQKEELVEKITESHEFDIPESILQREIEALVYEEKTIKKSEKKPEELEIELKPKAVKAAKALLLVSAIGDKEGIDVTDDELREKILDTAQRLGTTPESIMKIYLEGNGSLESLRYSIFKEKVLNMLYTNAVIEKGGQS